jgi:hypothetical protein
MLVDFNDKINGFFISQMSSKWIVKLPSNLVGHTYRMAMYIWYLKGVKKSNDLVVTLKGINSFLPIPRLGFFESFG